MISFFSAVLGITTPKKNTANPQRRAVMTQQQALSGTIKRRIRSGSAPDRARQAAIDASEVEGSVIPALSKSQPLEALPSPHSTLPGRAAEHSSVAKNDDNYLKLRSELKRATQLNANLKEHVKCAETSLDLANQQQNALQIMLEEYEQREQSKNGDLVQAQAEIQHLKGCLDDCKERIFKMQPLEHMTDTDIAEQYRCLCESIADWTDTHFGDYDEPFSRLQACMSREIPARLIHEYLLQGKRIEMVQKYPTTGCTMITFLIHRHVHQSILRETLCYPSLGAQCEEFVSFITNAMRQNEPRRDEEAIQFWLTEVQRALSISPKMTANREIYLNLRSAELSDLLSTLLSFDQARASRWEELRKIFSEAADLAKNMRIAPSIYEFVVDYDIGGPLFLDDRDQFKIIDQATAQRLRSSDLIKGTSDGKVGHKLCVIHPGLVRKGKNNGRDIVLVKATILCKFDHHLSRRKKTKQAAVEGGERKGRAGGQSSSQPAGSTEGEELVEI